MGIGDFFGRVAGAIGGGIESLGNTYIDQRIRNRYNMNPDEFYARQEMERLGQEQVMQMRTQSIESAEQQKAEQRRIADIFDAAADVVKHMRALGSDVDSEYSVPDTIRRQYASTFSDPSDALAVEDRVRGYRKSLLDMERSELGVANDRRTAGINEELDPYRIEEAKASSQAAVDRAAMTREDREFYEQNEELIEAGKKKRLEQSLEGKPADKKDNSKRFGAFNGYVNYLKTIEEAEQAHTDDAIQQSLQKQAELSRVAMDISGKGKVWWKNSQGQMLTERDLEKVAGQLDRGVPAEQALAKLGYVMVDDDGNDYVGQMKQLMQGKVAAIYKGINERSAPNAISGFNAHFPGVLEKAANPNPGDPLSQDERDGLAVLAEALTQYLGQDPRTWPKEFRDVAIAIARESNRQSPNGRP